MPKIGKTKTIIIPRIMLDERLFLFVAGLRDSDYAKSYGEILTGAINLLEPGLPDYQPDGRLNRVFGSSLVDPETYTRLESYCRPSVDHPTGDRLSSVVRKALAYLMESYTQEARTIE